MEESGRRLLPCRVRTCAVVDGLSELSCIERTTVGIGGGSRSSTRSTAFPAVIRLGDDLETVHFKNGALTPVRPVRHRRQGPWV